MKKDRNELTDILTAIFVSNNKNKNNKLFDKMEDELVNKFPSGLLNDIYTTRKQMSGVLNEKQLYLITNFLYENYDLFKKYLSELTKDKINPQSWFTDKEITEANSIEIEYNQEEEVWLEIHNVDEVQEGLWISSHESYKNIVDNWVKGAILYNQETQREGIIKTILGEQITVPKLIDKNVNEIYKSMSNNEFFPNMITLNIQDTGAEKEYIYYLPNERILKVKKTIDSPVYILDGFHRLNSIYQLITNYPDFEGWLSIRIVNLSVSKAQSLILQESKGTSLGEQTIKTFDVKNKYMQLAKKINDYESESVNSMYHKMTYVIDELKNNNKYCLFTNVSNGLEDNFSDIIENGTPRDLDKLTRYLVAFYNEFLGIYDNYFKDLENTKREMVIADINIFSGLLLIARQLYEVKGWQDILEGILSSVIWDRTNNDWKNILTNSPTWNKSTKSKVYNYFSNILNERAGVI